ncbi:MFS transporter [Eggerthellaceae bacterium 24-137]
MTEQFPPVPTDNATEHPAEAGPGMPAPASAPAPAPAPTPDPASAPTSEPTLSAAGLPLPKNWLAIIAFIWAGQAVSMITSYAAGYAVVWYVTESTGSALALAVMNIAVMLPIGLISPFGGVVADKHNRKLIMVAADGAVGVISLVAALLILAGDVSIPLLLAVCVARAVGQAFHSPAMMAAMPMLVPDKHLLRINTLDQLLASVAAIGAPAFGIFLYTTLGFSSVMFLDFAGACVAILGLALAKIPTVVDTSAETQHVLANLRDGWHAIAKTRGLVLLIAGVTVGMMIFGPLSAVFPLMTYDYFGGDGYAASIVEGAFGVGMLVGSGILIAWGGGKRLAGLIAVAAVIVGAATAACGLLPSSAFPAFIGLVVVMAVACAWFNGPTMTLTQRNVPDDKMGRAMGLLTAAMGLATPVGVAIGGVLAEVMGIAPFFLVDGLACLALGLVLYLPKSVRALDEK